MTSAGNSFTISLMRGPLESSRSPFEPRSLMVRIATLNILKPSNTKFEYRAKHPSRTNPKQIRMVQIQNKAIHNVIKCEGHHSRPDFHRDKLRRESSKGHWIPGQARNDQTRKEHRPQAGAL